MSAAQRRRNEGSRSGASSAVVRRRRSPRSPPAIGLTVRLPDVHAQAWSRRAFAFRGVDLFDLVGVWFRRLRPTGIPASTSPASCRRTRNHTHALVGSSTRQRYCAPVRPRTRSSFTRSESDANRATP